MNLLLHLSDVGAATMLDVLPIVLILAFFQIVVIRKKPANLQRIVTGFLYVLLGLTLFLVGLQEALFPIGEIMAKQLTERVKNYIRHTEDYDQVNAGQMTRKVDGLYAMDSRHTVMVSKKDTKIDGERIHMG